MQLFATTAEILRVDLLPSGGNKSNGKRGRPEKPNSEAKVAERIGVPRQTINDAKQHVAAVERYPVLEGRGIPQKHAITIAKNLDKLPVKDRNEKIEKLSKYDPETTIDIYSAK